MPWQIPEPRRVHHRAMEVAVLARRFRFQPISPTLRIACAEPLGPAQEQRFLGADQAARRSAIDRGIRYPHSIFVGDDSCLTLSPSPSFRP